jgi:DNA-binding transcriptional ArsR family regulator
MRNVGHETQMRAELAEAVGCVIYHADIEATTLTDVEMSQIMKASDITTYARTAVEFDYSGEVIDSHMPEAPTRFAKQLAQLFRGCVALGMARDRAMQLVIRCARDSVPPLTLSILLDLAAHPDSRPGDVRARIGKPWRTVKRSLEALTMIGLTECDERRDEGNGVDDDKRKTVWRYRLSSTLDRETLLAMAGQTTPAACQVMAAEVQQRIGAGQPLAPTHVQALEAIRGRLKAGEQLSLSEERLLSASMTTEF